MVGIIFAMHGCIIACTSDDVAEFPADGNTEGGSSVILAVLFLLGVDAILLKINTILFIDKTTILKYTCNTTRYDRDDEL